MTKTIVSSGHFSSGIVLHGGDLMYVYSGGHARDTQVDSGGKLYMSGGHAVDTQVSSDGQFYVSGGVATSTEIFSQGGAFVTNGGTAVGTSVEGFGRLTLEGGGSSIATTLSGKPGGAKEVVSSGGNAFRTTILAHGDQEVLSGGITYGTIISSGGGQVVSSGAVENQTVVSNTAFDTVYGDSFGTTLLPGGFLNQFGGETHHTTIEAYTLFVAYGGTVLDPVLSGLGATLSAVEANVNCSSAVVGSGADLTVSKGTVEGTAVLSGGTLTLIGGIVDGTVLHAGGMVDLPALAFASGGTLTVKQYSNAALVTVTENGQSAAIHLAGQYTDTAFSFAQQGSGTLVTLHSEVASAAGKASSAIAPLPARYPEVAVSPGQGSYGATGYDRDPHLQVHDILGSILQK